MQTRDVVEGLHNCREFSQPLSCLYQARKTFSIAEISNFFLARVHKIVEHADDANKVHDCCLSYNLLLTKSRRDELARYSEERNPNHNP